MMGADDLIEGRDPPNEGVTAALDCGGLKFARPAPLNPERPPPTPRP
jgi:hypothetical protein